MSGLAVLYERGGAPAAAETMAAMLGRLRPRGPDRTGQRVDGSLALGHCMLETTPEDALGAQPLGRAGADRFLVADARLDNRNELLQALPATGASAAGVSDAELILRAYEQWGDACPTRLLGDFAFALWDGERRRLFCARDPIGVRPLYYHEDRRTFRCASEMHALFADPRVPRRPHRLSMGLFLTYHYTERRETLWDGVLSLPAGHTLTVTSDATRCDAYWRPDPARRVHYRDRQSYADHFREVFTEAVRCRLRSSRPMAAQVSGGLDSSSVACVAERLRREGRVSGAPLTLMRLAFPGLACDERAYSQAVADRLGLPITTVLPMDDLALCRPEPARSARDVYFHPTLVMGEPLITAALDRGLRTTLTGMGSDQLMHRTGVECAGYLRRGDLWRAARETGLTAHPASAGAWRALVRGGVAPLAPPRWRAALRRAGRRSYGGAFRWLERGIEREVRDHVEATERETQAIPLHADPVARELASGWLHTPDIPLGLARVGRHVAGFGAEERHPFLDLRVVELLLSMPSEERFDEDLTKPVLRRAMEGTLPPLVRERRDSADFTCYLRRCFLEPYWAEVRGSFDASRLEDQGIIDGATVRRSLDETGPAGPHFDVIDLVALELWLRQPT